MEKATKQQIIKEYATHESDVGSTEVQAAVLSARIRELTEHMKANKHDYSTRRGLVAMVNRRRKLLRYLESESPARYQELIKRLGLRR